MLLDRQSTWRLDVSEENRRSRSTPANISSRCCQTAIHTERSRPRARHWTQPLRDRSLLFSISLHPPTPYQDLGNTGPELSSPFSRVAIGQVEELHAVAQARSGAMLVPAILMPIVRLVEPYD
jgi:hypothetical protein